MLFSKDALTGQERWAFHTDGMIFCGPTVANDVLFVSSEWHSLYALRATTGEEIWNYYSQLRI